MLLTRRTLMRSAVRMGVGRSTIASRNLLRFSCTLRTQAHDAFYKMNSPPIEEVIHARAPFNMARGTAVRILNPDDDPIIDKEFGDSGLIGIVKDDVSEGSTASIVVAGDVTVTVTGIVSERVTVYPSKAGGEAPLTGLTCDLGGIKPPPSLPQFSGAGGPPIGTIVRRLSRGPTEPSPSSIPLALGTEEVVVRMPPVILYTPPPGPLQRLSRFVPIAVSAKVPPHLRSEIMHVRVVIASAAILACLSVTSTVVVIAAGVPLAVMNNTYRDCFDPSWQQYVLDGLITGARIALLLQIVMATIASFALASAFGGDSMAAYSATLGLTESGSGAVSVVLVGVVFSILSMAGSGRFRRTWRLMSTAVAQGRYRPATFKDSPFQGTTLPPPPQAKAEAK